MTNRQSMRDPKSVSIAKGPDRIQALEMVTVRSTLDTELGP